MPLRRGAPHRVLRRRCQGPRRPPRDSLPPFLARRGRSRISGGMTTNGRVRVLVADDEPLARERLRTLLAREDWIELIGECPNGTAAIDAITRLKPDLVFLDIQMPGASGFEVIEAIGPARMPLVVFVTAFDQYALRAFDVHALDYLLKPFDREGFQEELV